jgi:hypothetical protein
LGLGKQAGGICPRPVELRSPTSFFAEEVFVIDKQLAEERSCMGFPFSANPELVFLTAEFESGVAAIATTGSRETKIVTMAVKNFMVLIPRNKVQHLGFF